MKSYMKKTFLYLLVFLVTAIAACKKDYLDTKPSNAATEQEIFSKYTAATAALGGIYNELYALGIGDPEDHRQASNFGQKAQDLSCDIMGNDMIINSQGYNWFTVIYNFSEWQNANSQHASDEVWSRYYDIIKQANKLINNVDGVTDASDLQKESIKGQAYGLRAYAYYYLVNYFQQSYKGHETQPGVPVYIEETLVGKGRGTVQDVYNQILEDLDKAESLLSGKTRESKANMDVSVVQSFKARTALVMEDWATAATYANKARSGYTLMPPVTYKSRSAFSSVSNPECIWGSVISEEKATIFGSFFSHLDISTGGYAAAGEQKKITKALYDQIHEGDVRKTVFTKPGTGDANNPDYNQMKFRVPVPGKWAADYIYIRSAEMYLIEAEALARQGKETEARTALETLVKARYPAYSAGSYSGTGLINEILLQRRIELWGEGFALLDIKRLNQGLNRPKGPGNHGAPNFDPGIYTTAPADPGFLMRIPKRELDNNVNMTQADQNP